MPNQQQNRMPVPASLRPMRSGAPTPRLPAIHWGWLLVVTGAHAAGLLALSGLGGDFPTPPPAVAPTISVELLQPEARQPANAPPLAHGDAAPLAEHTPHGKATPPTPPVFRRGSASMQKPDTAVRPPSGPGTPIPLTTPLPAPSHDIPAVAGTPAPATAPVASGPHQEPAVAPYAIAASPRQDPATPPAAARHDAAYLQNPAPAYPKISRRRGEEGKVLLRVRILTDGRADTVEIAESSGHPRLDEAALEAVRHWRFVSARQGDTPFDSWLRVPVVFRLDD